MIRPLEAIGSVTMQRTPTALFSTVHHASLDKGPGQISRLEPVP